MRLARQTASTRRPFPHLLIALCIAAIPNSLMFGATTTLWPRLPIYGVATFPSRRFHLLLCFLSPWVLRNHFLSRMAGTDPVHQRNCIKSGITILTAFHLVSPIDGIRLATQTRTHWQRRRHSMQVFAAIEVPGATTLTHSNSAMTT
jgi:hypothetical protein